MTDAPTIANSPETKEPATETPRLSPIEEPDSWWAQLAYLFARWDMGTVITPLKVVGARFPESLRLSYEMDKLEKRLTLDPELRLLVKTLVATLNGCSFCQDIARADADTEDISREKLSVLLDYDTSSAFSEVERAALSYAEEVTREVDTMDDTFDALLPHFSEREIIQLTWLIAMENYYNLLNRPLGIGSDNLCEPQAP